MLTRWLIRRTYKLTGVETEFLTDFVTTDTDIAKVCEDWCNAVWDYKAVKPVMAEDWEEYPRNHTQAVAMHMRWREGRRADMPKTLLREWYEKLMQRPPEHGGASMIACRHNFDGPYHIAMGQTGIKAEWRKQYCKKCGHIEAYLHDFNPPKEIKDQPCERA